MPKSTRSAKSRPPRKTAPRSPAGALRAKGPKATPKAASPATASALKISTQLLHTMQTQAALYLRKHKGELGIPGDWVDEIDPSVGPDLTREGAHLRWLLPAKLQGSPVDPRLSFVYDRRGSDPDQLLVVLLASLVWRDAKAKVERPLWGGQGVRVVIRVVRRARRGQVQIITMAASASLPKVAGGDVTAWNAKLRSADVAYLLDSGASARWVTDAGLDPALYGMNQVGLSLDDFVDRATPPSTRFAARLMPRRFPAGGAPAGLSADAPAYAFEGVVGSAAGHPPQLTTTRRYPLFALLNKRIYLLDPPTRDGCQVLFPSRPAGMHSGRPWRSWLELDWFRFREHFGALNQLADPGGRFFVGQSRHVEAGAPGFNENQPVAVGAGTMDSIRSDGAAALNAFVRAAEFFLRIDNWYGLPMPVQFRFVNLPLIVRYRAGIVPGAGDGRTINAQARWAPTMPPESLPSNLEVRLALADLQSNEGRVRAIDRTGRVNCSPLSIAVSNRWCWHEFGHVLIAGATGELELEFAHSVGDALGAILCDPYSKLADQDQWRGVTFPFQSLPNRRHDRTAADGWSWSGAHYRPNRYFAGVGGHHVLSRGGYCSEQIMSSTLFQLYRSLGGDAPRTGGGRYGDFRKLGAEHTAALIMAGVGILGPAMAIVARSAEDFAASMMAADSTMPPLALIGGTRSRYGGMANKVIRWAFEHQGAFAGPQPLPLDHNAPGSPPAVDVLVKSLRLGEAGGYQAVTFKDQGHFADPRSLWVRQAPSGAGDQNPVGGQDNYVFATANNRGQATGKATMARMWCAQLAISANAPLVIPAWTDPAWVALSPYVLNADGPNDVPNTPPGVTFGPFLWPGAVSRARYAILAEMSCAADPSNLDPALALPCASSPCNVEELVAFDNNLALRIVTAV